MHTVACYSGGVILRWNNVNSDFAWQMAGSSLFGKPTGMVCWRFRAAGTQFNLKPPQMLRGRGEGPKLVRKLRTVLWAQRGKKMIMSWKFVSLSLSLLFFFFSFGCFLENQEGSEMSAQWKASNFVCLAKLSLSKEFKGEEKADKEKLKHVLQQRGAKSSGM